jgi:3-oxoacyl-[acyl-carrier protein] reductase
MDLGLKDKVAIITGSARGLGAATARRLAEEGAKVVITDIQSELAQATTAALRAEGHSAHCVIADITKSDDVQRLVTETVATFGGVHILVNNAGFPRDKYLVKMSEDDWDLVIGVMLKGAFLASRAVMPHMIEHGWPTILLPKPDLSEWRRRCPWKRVATASQSTASRRDSSTQR